MSQLHKERLQCSLCYKQESKFHTYTNNFCNHKYCSDCICRIHIPNSDKMKCLVKNCSHSIIIDDLDDFFFQQQFAMLDKQETAIESKVQDRSNCQLDTAIQPSKIQSVYHNKAEPSQIRGIEKKQANKESSQIQSNLVNVHNHQENEPMQSKPTQQQFRMLSQDELLQMCQARPSQVPSDSRKMSEIRPLDFKETEKFCAKCLKFLEELPETLQMNQCKKHQVCFGCLSFDLRKEGFGCEICDRWNY